MGDAEKPLEPIPVPDWLRDFLLINSEEILKRIENHIQIVSGLSAEVMPDTAAESDGERRQRFIAFLQAPQQRYSIWEVIRGLGGTFHYSPATMGLDVIGIERRDIHIVESYRRIGDPVDYYATEEARAAGQKIDVSNIRYAIMRGESLW